MQAEELNPVEQAERQWQHWLEQAAEAGVSSDFSAPFVTELKRVWEASDYVAQCCLRDA